MSTFVYCLLSYFGGMSTTAAVLMFFIGADDPSDDFTGENM